MEITELGLLPQERNLRKKIKKYSQEIGFLPLSRSKIDKNRRKDYGTIIDKILDYKSREDTISVYSNRKDLYVSENGATFICTIGCESTQLPLLVEIHTDPNDLPIYVCDRNLELLDRGLILLSLEDNSSIGEFQSNNSNNVEYFTFREITEEINS